MSKSKQINFFIVPNDWLAIDSFFKQAGVNVISVPIASINHLFANLPSNDLSASQLYLTNNEPGKNLVLNPIKLGYYVDVVRSNVIEFSRGGFSPTSEKILDRARFYTVFKFYDDEGELITKDAAFKKWVDSVYKSFKHTFLKKTEFDKDFQFSEKAAQWMRDNNAHVDTAGWRALSNTSWKVM